MFQSKPSTHLRLTFVLITLVIALTTTPAFSAEPEVADPDPDEMTLTTPRVLVLDDPAQLDKAQWPPGRYIVRIVDRQGTVQETFEIRVPAR